MGLQSWTLFPAPVSQGPIPPKEIRWMDETPTS
jgi:hypothetical protein